MFRRLLIRSILASIPLFWLLGTGTGPAEPVGSASAQEQLRPTFVGIVAGTDAYIGLVTNGSNLVVYVCDGLGYNLANGFRGSVQDAQDGVLTLQGRDNILRLEIDAQSLPEIIASGRGISGSLSIGGVGNNYVLLEPARGPGGLWLQREQLEDGSTVEGGWVVLNNGSIRGGHNCTPMSSGTCSGGTGTAPTTPAPHSAGNPPNRTTSVVSAGPGGASASAGAWGGAALDADTAAANISSQNPPPTQMQVPANTPNGQRVNFNLGHPGATSWGETFLD